MQQRFENLIKRARLVLFLEQLWPFLAALACLAGLFLIVSFAGLWLGLPGYGRVIGVAVFGVAALGLVFVMARLRLPARAAALRRLDESHSTKTGVASALDDQLLHPEPIASGIFAEHKRRLNALADGLRVRLPVLNLAKQDPFALRAAIVLGLVATAFLAGEERSLRIFAAFDANIGFEPAVPARLDAWLTPPAYTGQAPQILIGEKIASPQAPILVPAGSILKFSGQDIGKLRLDIPAGLEPLQAETSERSFKVVADAVVNVPLQGGVRHLSFQAIADVPPQISLILPLQRAKRGGIAFKFKTQDDYGVRSAVAEIAGLDPSLRVLVPPPQLPLVLPPKHGLGEGSGTVELGDSPWAGARAKLALTATDDAGQSGHSEPLELTLPQKPYRNPLARALIEQRRDLLLTPDGQRSHVSRALGAMLIAPDVFAVPSAAYLGIRTAETRLKAADSDAALLDVGALLLDVAQGLEAGQRGGADKALQAAKDALREAIKNGASKEEIAKLMQELRAALDKALKEAAKNPNAPGKNAQKLSSGDLQDLLDKLEESAKSGDEDQAQALLDMLDNLTVTAQGEGEDGASPLDEALNGLDDLSREQQDLRDKTFSQNQDEQSQAEGNGDGESLHESLQKNQSGLRRKLEDLKKKLGENGIPGSGLGAAEEAMKQAEGALGKGKPGRGAAVEAQGKALEALRKEAQALAEQSGQGEQNTKSGKGGRTGKRDPLGRESPDENADGDKNAGSGTPKATSAARARRVFKEIQKRRAEAGRPALEQDYLDRLMKDF